MKKQLSKWSKEVKKMMIDYDLDMNDVATRLKWTSQYTSSIINGRAYQKESVVRISRLFNIEVPPENATLAKRKEIDT